MALKSKSTASSAAMTLRAASSSSAVSAAMASWIIWYALRPMAMAWLTAGSPSLRTVTRCGMISAMSEAWSPMRSMSVTTFMAVEMRRRSPATGCWRSSRVMQRCSMSRSMLLMRLSPFTIFWAASASAVHSASRAASTASAELLPISTSAALRASRSVSYCLRMLIGLSSSI